MTAADPAEFAPAKVNLFLHLNGQRPDGYHLLKSLVVFPAIGDRLTLTPGSDLTLKLGGPYGSALDAAENLVIRAARALADHHRIDPAMALHLDKHLPVAAGIGGGSSDAAATLRLLARHWGVDVPPDLALGLGADVPVCLQAPGPRIMSGIGEVIERAPDLPQSWMVLVNPALEVPTSAVFARVVERNPPPGPALPSNGFANFADFRDWLGLQRNDLQASAIAICPAIDQVLQSLAPAPIARMSGSGATCFALFGREAEARTLADHLTADCDWWVAVAPVSV